MRAPNKRQAGRPPQDRARGTAVEATGELPEVAFESINVFDAAENRCRESLDDR